MSINMESTTSLNRPGSSSLKTTIPAGVVNALKLKAGDKVVWNLEVKEGQIVAFVKTLGSPLSV